MNRQAINALRSLAERAEPGSCVVAQVEAERTDFYIDGHWDCVVLDDGSVHTDDSWAVELDA